MWAPPLKLTVSEWADKNRVLSQESSAEPGQWRTSRTPYLDEPMREATNPDIETITMMCSSQIGKTEMVNNIVGHAVDQDPCPILVVLPTLEIADAYSKDRLTPMVRDTPALRGKVHSARSRNTDNSTRHKKFRGGHITLAGANSPSSLASRPVRMVIFDEVDRFPASAGTEGDPISLARKRAVTFWNRKYIQTSTPTDRALSRILKAFEESDQRHYYLPCPHCGEYHILEWKHVIWEQDEEGNHLPETAAHVCPHCGGLESNADILEMIHEGEWRKHRPEVHGHAGFHINELYSPWVSLEQTVTAFLRAKDDPEQLRVWINTALGEPWDEGKQIGDAEILMARRENYDIALVPYDAVVVTVGVDVQEDRLELETVAWGKDYESWGLENVIIPGNTEQPETWAALSTYLTKKLDHESGCRLRILSTAIDSGFRTEQVYKFISNNPGRNIFAIKGLDGQGKPLVARPSKRNIAQVDLYGVGTWGAKDTLAARLTIEDHGAGYCHFPYYYDRTYFDQLLAEQPVIKYVRGYRVRAWRKKRAGIRNEALDCRVYSMAALAILGVDVNTIVEAFRQRLTSQATPKPLPRHSGLRIRSRGYAGNYA